MLRKQTALTKVNEEEDSVFCEPDDLIDTTLTPLFAEENMIKHSKPTKKLLNGDLLSSIAPKTPVATCYSHIQRGKCIGEGVRIIVILITGCY